MFFNIYKILVFFFRVKKVWHQLQQKNILIYDEARSGSLLKYFNHRDVSIYYNRIHHSSVLNMRVLIHALLLSAFSCFKNLNENYKKLFLKKIKPKFIFTFNENNLAFYKLKSICSNATTISIQASWKDSSLLDIFYYKNFYIKKKNYLKCDYFFCYNKHVGRYLNSFIKCKYIPIGSFDSNIVKKKKNKEIDLLYVSQFRGIPDNELILKDVTFYDFIYHENIFLINLAKYLNINNLKIVVLGSKASTADLERKFYSKIFKNNMIKFIPKTVNRESYSIVDSANLVIGVDSTMLYESFLRGNRTLFFNVRDFTKKSLKFRKFCWPAVKKLKGSFWTNESNMNEIKRLFLIKDISLNSWKDISNKVMDDIGIFNFNNRIFLSFMKKIKVPLKRKYLTF